MPKTPPKVDAERMQRAEEYIAAAREHRLAFMDLPDSPRHYPLAFYLAGLAVECVFRAYIELVGGQHDPAHDLKRLADAGIFLDFIPEKERDSIRRYITEVRVRWLNNHRYRARASLERYLKEAELYRLSGNRSVKGDVVKYNWMILSKATEKLTLIGIERWELSKQKWNK